MSTSAPIQPIYARYAADDLGHHPLITIWEVTRACALACRHCRAKSIPARNPAELTTYEGFTLMDQVKASGCEMLVLTGGDPMMRPDLYHLASYGAAIGLQMAVSPSGTARLTREALSRLKESGVSRISLSIDGSDAAVHDAFRGVKSTFARTERAIAWAREIGLSVQINTTVGRHNRGDLQAIANNVADWGADVWALFFLVPTGRALKEDMLSAAEHEEVYVWLSDLAERVPFKVKTTEGPAYRRVVMQQTGRRIPIGINDARGFAFVSHMGELHPSGFLPIAAGNVRQQPFGELYRESPLFRRLRDSEQLKGKCGRCPFRRVCGGSRARAYAMTGDYMASDPTCVFQP